MTLCRNVIHVESDERIKNYGSLCAAAPSIAGMLGFESDWTIYNPGCLFIKLGPSGHARFPFFVLAPDGQFLMGNDKSFEDVP